MKNCLECDFYETCESICADVEAYTNQDNVPDDNNIVYVPPSNLDYLAEKQTLTLADMQNDFDLGIQEWHYVKQAKLTKQQMQVTWLYFWEKLTQSEIAKKLDVGQPRVHKHLQLAKKKLIKILKNV